MLPNCDLNNASYIWKVFIYGMTVFPKSVVFLEYRVSQADHTVMPPRCSSSSLSPWGGTRWEGLEFSIVISRGGCGPSLVFIRDEYSFCLFSPLTCIRFLSRGNLCFWSCRSNNVSTLVEKLSVLFYNVILYNLSSDKKISTKIIET